MDQFQHRLPPRTNERFQRGHGTQAPAGHANAANEHHQEPAHFQRAQHNTTAIGDNSGQQGGAQSPVLNRPDWWMQLNSYGNKCAFQVESAQTKGNWFTVTVESAPRENPNDPNNRRYLWNQKTVVQMTKTELPVFAAVMLGMLPSARFDNHGDQGKFLEVINQDKNFFIKSGGGGGIKMHVAPIPIVDAYQYGTLALTQYARNFNGLTTEAALQIISRLATQLYNHNAFKPAQQR